MESLSYLIVWAPTIRNRDQMELISSKSKAEAELVPDCSDYWLRLSPRSLSFCFLALCGEPGKEAASGSEEESEQGFPLRFPQS